MKRIITTSALCLTVALTAAGCGGSSQASGATESQAQAQTGNGAGGRGPGGSGEVTAVSGSTAQVKGQDAQIAVTWTDSTTFTQQVAATASDVTVGSCVTVTSGSPSSSDLTDTVAAATVRVTQATNGACTMAGGGVGGRQGARGQAPSGERPTGMPDGVKGGGQRGGFASGEVTAVSDDGFIVASQQPGSDSGTSTPVTVTTSADTTYTTTKAATADDITVGACVSSRGDADDTGAITATTISVTEPVDGTCSTGFGRGRPADAS